MSINQDFSDLFAELNAAGARDTCWSAATFAQADLERPGMVIQLGVAPNRIDLVTSIDGVAFEDAWPSRTETTYGDHIVPVIGLIHLIENKRASGRPQDLADVEFLRKHRDS